MGAELRGSVTLSAFLSRWSFYGRGGHVEQEDTEMNPRPVRVT